MKCIFSAFISYVVIERDYSSLIWRHFKMGLTSGVLWGASFWTLIWKKEKQFLVLFPSVTVSFRNPTGIYDNQPNSSLKHLVLMFCWWHRREMWPRCHLEH